MNLNFNKYLIQRVLTVSTLCFLLFSTKSIAQDSIVKKSYHVVGVGIQGILPIEREVYTNFNSLTYNQPAYSIFYRHFFSFTPGKSVNSANLYITYRSVDAKKNVVSSSGSNHYQGKLDICRFDLGLSRLVVLGKRKGFQIGGGFGLGGLIYSSGNLKENLYRVNAYGNFEMNQRFKISKKSYLLMGSKSQLESADGFGYKLGVSETVFIAYMFN
jgi:hypothetical protein